MEITLNIDEKFCAFLAKKFQAFWISLGRRVFDEYVLPHAQDSVRWAIEDWDLPKENDGSHDDYIDDYESDWIEDWSYYPERPILIGNANFNVPEVVAEYISASGLEGFLNEILSVA